MSTPYPIYKFRDEVVQAALVLRRQWKPLKNCHPIVKSDIYHRYWRAYLLIYGYMYQRLSVDNRIDYEDRFDIRHSIFTYMSGGTGKNFFTQAAVIFKDREDSWPLKFFKVQNLIDRFIWSYWRSFIREEESNRILYEDMLDPQLCRDLSYNPDPEEIAIMRMDRYALVETLLKAPANCRIDIKTYERVAKEYLKGIYGGSSTRKYFMREDLTKFTIDYVIYNIRKILSKHDFSIDNVYNYGTYDAYIEPSLSQILADRLGVPNTFHTNLILRSNGEPTKKCKYERDKQTLREYQDYDRNHPQFLIPN